MNEIKEYTEKIFEDIKHIDEEDNEYWYARELMTLLEYSKWENFNKVIQKAINACQNSDNNVSEHFPDIRKTLEMPNNAVKEIIDYKLSRYACYLIAQNGDSRKKTIALAQTDAKLKRDNVDNEYTANSVHYEVGKEIRDSIKRLGGTMPEDLPTPNKSLKELGKEKNI